MCTFSSIAAHLLPHWVLLWQRNAGVGLAAGSYSDFFLLTVMCRRDCDFSQLEAPREALYSCKRAAMVNSPVIPDSELV
jgi:hypothetical protein